MIQLSRKENGSRKTRIPTLDAKRRAEDGAPRFRSVRCGPPAFIGLLCGCESQYTWTGNWESLECLLVGEKRSCDTAHYIPPFAIRLRKDGIPSIIARSLGRLICNNQSPLDLALRRCVLVMILWWKRMSRSRNYFSTATMTPVNARPIRCMSWAIKFIELFICDGSNKGGVFVPSHFASPLGWVH